MKPFRLALLLLMVLPNFAKSQAKDYFILFKDKANSPYSVAQPAAFLSQRAIQRRSTQRIVLTSRDLPPNPDYIAQINALTPVRYASRWMNGVMVRASATTLTQIKAMPFVAGVLWNGDLKNAVGSVSTEQRFVTDKFSDTADDDFGLAETQNKQLGIDLMHQDGNRGEGILIGILDSGFQNANNLDVLTPLFQGNHVKTTWDFVQDEANVYNDHSHGTNVLSIMAANQPATFIGTTPNADYALFRTEDVFSETRIEEIYWLLAAEKADSLGVDVINTSLGYNNFDNPAQNYSLSDLDGNHALISRAADWAAASGIIVVVSAGNEGNKAWKKITFPADADSVIAVGAVNANGFKGSFSSVGPAADNRIKPELAALGIGNTIAFPNNNVGYGNGTSYAAPLVAGLAAGFKQAFPHLTAMEIRELLLQSASQADNPDDELGYGIPGYQKAKELATLDKLVKESGQPLFIYPNPVTDAKVLKAILNDPDFMLPATVKVLNINGQSLKETTITQPKFNLGDLTRQLPAGTYFISVANEQKSITRKFIIE